MKTNTTLRNRLTYWYMVLVFLLLQYLNSLKELLSPLLRLIFAARRPSVVRTSSHRFDNLADYVFSPTYVELTLGKNIKLPRMHYLDEGFNPENPSQETLLCLHDELTWSFLFRKMIPKFVEKGYRVIAPDLIGYGKSDKYTSIVPHSYELHTLSLSLLIEYLNLTKNVTLVCHGSAGGLFGLSVVRDSPDIFTSLVILNVSLPMGGLFDEFTTHPFDPFFLVWRSLLQFLGPYFPWMYFYRWMCGFTILTSTGYLAPFPDSNTTAALFAISKYLLPIYNDDDFSPHIRSIRNFLKGWKKPSLVLFGENNSLIQQGMKELFPTLLPQGSFITIQKASHFFQETHGQELVERILEFKTHKKI